MNNDTLTKLPEYQCHKRVRAAKITRIDFTLDRSTCWLCLNDDTLPTVKVGLSWISKHDVEVGGWFVVYEDGYLSYSPDKAFSEGYKLVNPSTVPLNTFNQLGGMMTDLAAESTLHAHEHGELCNERCMVMTDGIARQVIVPKMFPDPAIFKIDALDSARLAEQLKDYPDYGRLEFRPLEPKQQIPSIGRIVHYRHTEQRIYPAIIQAVDVRFDDRWDLVVFMDDCPRLLHAVSMGDGAGQWMWPERT